MSWLDFQIEQDPDLPARSDDLTADQDAVSTPEAEPAESAPDLAELAKQLMLPLPFLEEIDWLLRDKRALILKGPPGSGKTYLARALANFYGGTRMEFLQFHPSYAYEDFVEGYRPVSAPPPGDDEAAGEASGGGELRYAVVGGPLRDMATGAAKNSDLHCMVIDEINRANLSKVFGELFFAIEYRDSPVRTQYSRIPLSVPPNIWFIGTMNTADRSVAGFDSALSRRFHFVDCDPCSPPFDDLLHRYLIREGLSSMSWLNDLLKSVNQAIPDKSFAVGPSHFMRQNITRLEAERIWLHSVWPYLRSRFDEDTIANFRPDIAFTQITWQPDSEDTIAADVAVQATAGTDDDGDLDS